jgi:hypothetical protein
MSNAMLTGSAITLGIHSDITGAEPVMATFAKGALRWPGDWFSLMLSAAKPRTWLHQTGTATFWQTGRRGPSSVKRGF